MPEPTDKTRLVDIRAPAHDQEPETFRFLVYNLMHRFRQKSVAPSISPEFARGLFADLLVSARMQTLRVTETVWPWRREATASARPPSFRLRGSLEAAVMLIVATVMFNCFDRVVPPVLLLVLATLVLIGAWFVSPLYAGIQRAVLALGVILGRAMAWLLLVPFFYTVFTLGRLGFAFARKDPLQRRYDPARASYWTPRPPSRGTASYSRQY